MDLPRPQYLSADHVLEEMARFGARRLRDASLLQLLVLALLAGAFIGAGALFSVLLTAGVEADGPRHLLAGLGFSAGFFFVILSEAALFTEANVVMPAVLLEGARRPLVVRVAVFLAVTLFVRANFQHAPANMGYFGLAMPQGSGPGWGLALLWNVIPVGIGNMLGGALLVAWPFWYALPHEARQDVRDRVEAGPSRTSGGTRP